MLGNSQELNKMTDYDSMTTNRQQTYRSVTTWQGEPE